MLCTFCVIGVNLVSNVYMLCCLKDYSKPIYQILSYNGVVIITIFFFCLKTMIPYDYRYFKTQTAEQSEIKKRMKNTNMAEYMPFTI